ncbi:MAG: hypothetical protein HY644_13475 [Acidobacteria bacterium]|nr:hypothetical protein [Acidobacteriota bacterium]
MKDDEKVFAELKNRATDSEHEQALTDLCKDLLTAFKSQSSEGVTDVIRAKMQQLHTDYNDVHSALKEKMGYKESSR